VAAGLTGGVLPRPLIAVLVLGSLALPVAAAPAQDPDRDLTVTFPQAPRNASVVPVSIRTADAAMFTARADVVVAGRRVVRVTARGLADRRAVDAGLGLGRFQRAAIDKAARRARAEPEIRVVVRAVLGGRVATEQHTRRLRRAPFYDMRLRAPDAPAAQSRAFSVAFDLPFEFTQVYGALAGRPAVGTFRKAVVSGTGRCIVTLTARATTSARRAALTGRGVVRGRSGPWRHARTTTEAVAWTRAPAVLPGGRRYLVARFGVDLLQRRGPCAGEDRRTGIAVLQRAVRTLAVRAAAPQPGPGFETA